MGNMSNPCINRWGLSSFWQKHWYSDLHYSLYLRQDNLIINLLQIYLKYGSNSPQRLFANPYWYKTIYKHSPTFAMTNRYNWITVRDTAFGFTDTHPMRLSRGEIFETQTCILRFNSWMVLNLYWFQPYKQKNLRWLKVKSRDELSLQSQLLNRYSQFSKLRKLMNLHQTEKYSF